jgi:large subunit ribosomal protein L10
MPTPEKERLVEELSKKLSESEVTILADYTGINVKAVTQLRDSFREASIEYRIYKNTLARIAAQNSGHENLLEFMDGPTGYVFSDDPIVPSKTLIDFIKSNPSMTIKCALLNGKLLDASEIRALASLPAREVLLAQLLGQFLAPISGLANVLNGPIRNLIYALEDMRKKKEAA